mmetsp:Transcript_33029/g.79916  ORF Transcript_33029/g.79916 Transcript_33029/m.79916 type:complete len:221 (+) Transcript_33029:2012-2674(+)
MAMYPPKEWISRTIFWAISINLMRKKMRQPTLMGTFHILTKPVFGLETIKYPTKPLNTTIKGTVTNVQNGQHGPATTSGLPSFFSAKKNMEPTRRAQQQKNLLKSSVENVRQCFFRTTGPDDPGDGLIRSACSRSHLTDTANTFFAILSLPSSSLLSGWELSPSSTPDACSLPFPSGVSTSRRAEFVFGDPSSGGSVVDADMAVEASDIDRGRGGGGGEG